MVRKLCKNRFAFFGLSICFVCVNVEKDNQSSDNKVAVELCKLVLLIDIDVSIGI